LRARTRCYISPRRSRRALRAGAETEVAGWIILGLGAVVAGALLVLVEVATRRLRRVRLVLIGSDLHRRAAGSGMALRNPRHRVRGRAVLCVIYIGAGRKLVRAAHADSHIRPTPTR
jgi:hypothetical protein